MLKIGILGKIYYALIIWFLAGRKAIGRNIFVVNQVGHMYKFIIYSYKPKEEQVEHIARFSRYPSFQPRTVCSMVRSKTSKFLLCRASTLQPIITIRIIFLNNRFDISIFTSIICNLLKLDHRFYAAYRDC